VACHRLWHGNCHLRRPNCNVWGRRLVVLRKSRQTPVSLIDTAPEDTASYGVVSSRENRCRRCTWVLASRDLAPFYPFFMMVLPIANLQRLPFAFDSHDHDDDKTTRNLAYTHIHKELHYYTMDGLLSLRIVVHVHHYYGNPAATVGWVPSKQSSEEKVMVSCRLYSPCTSLPKTVERF
jgi:hypothetical protein